MKSLSSLSTWLSRRRGSIPADQPDDPSATAKGDAVSLDETAQTEQPEHLRYTIGTLAEAIGIQSNAVVYYERIGLLPKPPRTRGNYRAYGKHDLARIRFIRRARDLGFSLEQVRTLLQLADHEGNDLREFSASARDQLTDVNQRIAQLNALRRSLKEVITQCDQGELSHTQIIKALSSRSR